MFRYKALSWLGAGGIIGALAFWFVGVNPILGFAVGVAISYFTTMLLAQSAASLAKKTHNPSGESTPHKREYSRARAHQIRGEFAQAIAMWQLHCTEHPEDPEPYIELARLYHNELGDFENAVRWFKKARDESDIDSGRALLATQEIIEVYTRKMNQPKRAIPELALLLEKWSGSPGADSARRQLQDLRAQLASELER